MEWPINQTAQLVFPHQLFEETNCLDKTQPIFLIEEFLFFKQYLFHQQKIAFHRGSMKFYENYLKSNGFEVIYLESNHPLSDVRQLLCKLKQNGYTTIKTYDVCDNWLEKRLQNSQLNLIMLPTPLFLNTKEELKPYFKGKNTFHQTDFYKQQRVYRNILMENGKPLGGKWTYDIENRKKYPKDKQPPHIHLPNNNAFYEEAKSYTQEHFSKNYGELNDQQIYPIAFSEAKDWLQRFLEQRFLEFGTYEDSILEESSFLHHSVLSPLLNVGLLTPKYVLEKALTYGKENNIPINSVEGFVRQIIGWREFIRGVYIYKGSQERKANFWQHQQVMPNSFYTAKTGILPVDSTIKKILKTSYAHHIERLMILANFMNLSEIDPNQVYKWFMELFIDAYDWVMVPNVYGMSSFADGGIMSTKPYISGSNYLKKMSNYPDGKWTTVWDALFWHFMHKNQSFFEKNPRLSMMLKTFEKMPAEKKQQHLAIAKNVIKNLNNNEQQ